MVRLRLIAKRIKKCSSKVGAKFMPYDFIHNFIDTYGAGIIIKTCSFIGILKRISPIFVLKKHKMDRIVCTLN